MAKPLVILHGWSDHAESFRPLAAELGRELNVDASVISLGDWISLDDEVTYLDLADAMERAWRAHGLPTGAQSVDAVIHSTGGLVIRQWMLTHYPKKPAPIHRLVMLAPANFGSPLAHHGRAIYGRIRTGFKKGEKGRRFETGKHLLEGLELGSSYSYNLALQDLFGARGERFGKGGVLCSVLVGNEGNVGPLGMLEFDGADGTVRTSTASLRCQKMDAFFEAKPKTPTVKAAVEVCSAKTAFRVIPDINHGQIVRGELERRGSKKRFGQDEALRYMVEALTVTDTGFNGMVKRWDDEMAVIQAEQDKKWGDERNGHHNFMLRVDDDHGAGVDDYVVEFYNDDDFDARGELKSRRKFTRKFNKEALDDVHGFSGDASYRCFHVDTKELGELLDDTDGKLSVSVTAVPRLVDEEDRRRDEEGYPRVGYYCYDDGDIGSISFTPAQARKFFAPHATTIARFTLEREQLPEAFVFLDAHADGDGT